MNIDSLTIGEAREIAKAFGVKTQKPRKSPFVPGSKWFIRTVTNFWTGEVVSVVGGFIVLKTCAWIADAGRYSDAVSADALREVEPAEDGTLVAIASIVDARPWTGDLPTKQK